MLSKVTLNNTNLLSVKEEYFYFSFIQSFQDNNLKTLYSLFRNWEACVERERKKANTKAIFRILFAKSVREERNLESKLRKFALIQVC